MSKSDILAEQFKTWQDPDGSLFNLGVVLGFWAGDQWFQHKPMLWSSNPISETLLNMLDQLVACGALLMNDSKGYQEFKYNPDFTTE